MYKVKVVNVVLDILIYIGEYSLQDWKRVCKERNTLEHILENKSVS